MQVQALHFLAALTRSIADGMAEVEEAVAAALGLQQPGACKDLPLHFAWGIRRELLKPPLLGCTGRQCAEKQVSLDVRAAALCVEVDGVVRRIPDRAPSSSGWRCPQRLSQDLAFLQHLMPNLFCWPVFKQWWQSCFKELPQVR